MWLYKVFTNDPREGYLGAYPSLILALAAAHKHIENGYEIRLRKEWVVEQQ